MPTAREMMGIGSEWLRAIFSAPSEQHLSAVTRLQAGTRGMQARRASQTKRGEAGYIRVGVRVRPLGEGRGESGKLAVDPRNGTITAPELPAFSFENVYESESNQGLFEAVGIPLVHSVVTGYNGTIFAYGQTGSGKSACAQSLSMPIYTHMPIHTRIRLHAHTHSRTYA